MKGFDIHTKKPVDRKKAEEELKKCPKIVRDYVELLKSDIELSNARFLKRKNG